MKTKILEKLFYTYIYSEKALIAYLRSGFFPYFTALHKS